MVGVHAERGPLVDIVVVIVGVVVVVVVAAEVCRCRWWFGWVMEGKNITCRDQRSGRGCSSSSRRCWRESQQQQWLMLGWVTEDKEEDTSVEQTQRTECFNTNVFLLEKINANATSRRCGGLIRVFFGGGWIRLKFNTPTRVPAMSYHCQPLFFISQTRQD